LIPNFELVDAYVDHCIKEIYRDFVEQILVNMSKDDLEYFRKQAMDMLVELMSNKPEIEEVILSILINKLGDGSRKVQQHSIKVLCKLVKNHPEMATVIIHENHMFLQRAGIKPAQKYYSVLFLNKIGSLCGSHSEQVRINLFRVYFYLFKDVM